MVIKYDFILISIYKDSVFYSSLQNWNKVKAELSQKILISKRTKVRGEYSQGKHVY